MEKINQFAATPKGNLDVDWNRVENFLGFRLHENLKDFYSRILCEHIRGVVDFSEEKFIKKTGNQRNDKWFSFNECEGETEYKLIPLNSLEKAEEFIKYAFEEWTGGNDFGRRAVIGKFYCNIGDILILLNNDTGKIEWIDCEYGYFDHYEENPNGILADDVQEFLDKLI